nr:hypothetical protein [Alistipes onderdonkii]
MTNEFGSLSIENGNVTIELSSDGTVWMTQSQIARLFGVLCQPSTAIFVQSTRRSK